MNKIYKYILVGIAIISIFITSFSSADNYELPQQSWEGNILYNGLRDYVRDSITFDSSNNVVTISNNVDFVCFRSWSSNPDYSLNYSVDNGYTWYRVFSREIGCTDSKTIYFKNGTVDFFYFIKGDGYIDTDYTSLQCQTEYNLIPISEVTANYCALNFGMIDPQECPITPSGSGTVTNRSALYINETQYPGNGIINLGIPDYIGRNITYNDNQNIIDIEGYNADEEYIENVINKEKLTPTAEEFGKMITGLATFIPYLFIALLILRMVKIFNKIWK